jgi:hypothetical protein
LRCAITCCAASPSARSGSSGYHMEQTVQLTTRHLQALD